MWTLHVTADPSGKILASAYTKHYFLEKNYATCEIYFCSMFYVTEIAYTSGDWLDIVKNEIKKD